MNFSTYEVSLCTEEVSFTVLSISDFQVLSAFKVCSRSSIVTSANTKCLQYAFFNLRRKNITSTRGFAHLVFKTKIFSHVVTETSRSANADLFIILCAVVLQNQYPKWVYSLPNTASKLIHLRTVSISGN